jgi:hypothetical protein
MRNVDSKFSFNPNKSMTVVEVDVASDGWLQNFTIKKDQAMNGTIPWRGPREKSPGFWQVSLVEKTVSKTTSKSALGR